MDPLGLRGRVIGLSHDEKKKYEIVSFSHPCVTQEYDEKEDRMYPKVGYMVIYSVQFNFKYAGRKVVSFKAKSLEIEGHSELQKERFKKSIVDFLERISEELLANNIDDIRLPWDEQEGKNN